MGSAPAPEPAPERPRRPGHPGPTPPSGPRRDGLTFRTKVYAGIAIIVTLGVAAMFVTYRNVENVAGYLGALDRVSVPFSIAALEMEKNTGEYSAGVLRYLSDPDSALRHEAQNDVVDFEERHATYMRLATSDPERALGHRVKAEHGKLIAAGNALMIERDRLDTVFEQTVDALEQIDVLIDGPLTAAAPLMPTERGIVLAALRDIEAESAEVGFWLTLFKQRPTPSARDRLLEKVQEQHEAVARLEPLRLGAEAQPAREAVARHHRAVSDNVGTLLPGEARISQRAQAFARQAEFVDDIFDDEVQPLLLYGLAEPRQRMDESIAQLQRTLRYLIPAYFVVALLVGLLLIRTIIRPLKRLAAGTEAIGSGNLDYRLDDHGGGEFGTLAGQFNAMAQRLKDSTVSRALLEASERDLRQTVLDLRQEMLERQQAEREREQLQAQLRQSETLATMGQLVAGVAHEVRNPLFGISSTLDAMEAATTVDATNAKYLEVLRREASRLNSLMTDLLEYGRTPSPERRIEPLSRSLVEAIRICQPGARAAGVTVTNRASDDTLVKVNRDRLLQVHVNLIDNAVQHAPEGSEVVITTRMVVDAAGGRWIEYHVMDSGSGFAIDDLPRVFDPFFTRRRKGTGLGLAIVRRVVDEHRGSIEAGNRPEGGAIMTVRLPAADDAA